MKKTCSCCNTEKELKDFHKKHTSSDGRDTRCKICRTQSQKADYHQKLEHYLWKNAKNRSKKSGLEFDITEEDIIIPECCPILKIPLYIVSPKSMWDNSPSLDRIDNSKGYVKGNIAVISLRANRIKSFFTLQDIELMIDSMDRLIKYMKKELY